MQGAAPMPDEREARRARIARLEAIIAEREAAEAEEAQQLTSQLNDIVPNAGALAMEAANDPSVTRFNAKEWFRARMPSSISSDTIASTIIVALFSLYMIYAGGVASMGLGDPSRRPVPPPRLLPWMPIPTPMMAKPDGCHGDSVVDEVFAKAETRKHA